MKSSEAELRKHSKIFSIKNAKCLLKKDGRIQTLRYVAEHIETVGNHCLAILKLFELTQDKEFIEMGINFLERAAKRNGKAYFWGFSDAVSDIPPDADDTAIALLVFLLAKKLKICYPKKFLNKKSFEQFDSLISESGGVFLYFGRPRRNDDVDPIVNTITAFLLEFSGMKTKARVSIRKYLNSYFEGRKPFLSEYYRHEGYFLLRCAKLNLIFPYYFSSKAKKEMENRALDYKPKSRMGKIFTEAARIILNKKRPAWVRRNNSLIFPESLYIQRTPFYEYGSLLENRLFEAELKELKKKTPKHYVIALSKIPDA